MAPKYIRTLSSDVLNLSTRSWKRFSFPYLIKENVVRNVDRRVGQCGDVNLPHCPTMISHENHTWVLLNQIGHTLCVHAMLSTKPQNHHIHDGNLEWTLFLGFKPKNKADVLCVLL